MMWHRWSALAAVVASACSESQEGLLGLEQGVQEAAGSCTVEADVVMSDREIVLLWTCDPQARLSNPNWNVTNGGVGAATLAHGDCVLLGADVYCLTRAKKGRDADLQLTYHAGADVLRLAPSH